MESLNARCLVNDNIFQLELLKKLHLQYISNETLIDLIKYFPALKELTAPSSKLSIGGIKQALQYTKDTQLSVLMVEFTKVNINIHDYEAILNLAKSGDVKVKIYHRDGKINVPNKLLVENRNWLDVQKDPYTLNFVSTHINL